MFGQPWSCLSPFLRRVVGPAAAAALGALLVACGGGGDPATRTTYAYGRVAGFGSVIVNGVHYDESAARIRDEDGAGHAGSDLKLGMMVEIRGDGSAAREITFLSLMRGPLESVAAGGFVVLGQTVAVNAGTVFGESLSGGLASLQPGLVVRVFGLLDPAGGYTATRVEAAGADSYALLGFVTAQDASAGTISIGDALIDVSGVTLPAGVTVGSLVRVKLEQTMVNGAWVASAVKSGVRRPHEGAHAEIEGIVTDFTSTTSFSVDGQPVDAGNAEFPDGSAGVVLGARVEVEGEVVNGVLVATKVEVESEDELEAEGFEVSGTIAALDTVGATFVVHGVTVSYGATVLFVGGTAADLREGAEVEVRGALAPDGSTLNAARIEFEH